jgi:glucose/arabinose dehydrogenase
MRMTPDGSKLEIYARGVRNTVGFDWHPETHVLWFTDNGRDWMGDDRPPVTLNRAPEKGAHFGFPYCHAGRIPDPEYGGKTSCDAFLPPAIELGPHVAALGMTLCGCIHLQSEASPGDRLLFSEKAAAGSVIGQGRQPARRGGARHY